ncbi:MAG: antibiotic biosynthesis monooxygenase [Acidobacteria bacterium]|nr:antibiotic biosynthesis monooxygenase [Acidobacteriota bacterium]
MASEPVVVVITYRAQPGHGPRALSELQALVREVVAREPDCGGIRIHRDPDDDTRVLLYEEWSSREAYQGPHMQTAHLGVFMTSAREFLAGPPTIELWQLEGDHTRS